MLKKQNILNTNHSSRKIFSQEDRKTSETCRKKERKKTEEKEKD